MHVKGPRDNVDLPELLAGVLPSVRKTGRVVELVGVLCLVRLLPRPLRP